MQQYFDHRTQFLEPEIIEYCGSHPIMTNVMKPVKTKYVSFDTRFSKDTILTNQIANPISNPYTASTQIEFPERIQNVRSIRVLSTETPLSHYNISHYLQNTSFTLIFTTSTTPITRVVDISDGYYTSSELNDLINTAITGSYPLVFDTKTNMFSKMTFTPNGTYLGVSVHFEMDPSTALGSVDRSNLKSKLGWLLGFRKSSYTLNTTTAVVSEAFRDMNGPKYMYLAVDEFNNSAPQSTFLSMLPNSLINSNILARISIDSYKYNKAFGTYETATESNGFLLTDTREYADDIDLQKLGVQLVDEYGRPMSLNGLDFSFSLEIKHT